MRTWKRLALTGSLVLGCGIGTAGTATAAGVSCDAQHTTAPLVHALNDGGVLNLGQAIQPAQQTLGHGQNGDFNSGISASCR